MRRVELIRTIGTYGVVIALAALVLFGFLRYDRFLSTFNVMSVLRYNSMFALVSLGMCFVIMTGGIDLSVGAVAAMGSVASALASPLMIGELTAVPSPVNPIAGSSPVG